MGNSWLAEEYAHTKLCQKLAKDGLSHIDCLCACHAALEYKSKLEMIQKERDAALAKAAQLPGIIDKLGDAREKYDACDDELREAKRDLAALRAAFDEIIGRFHVWDHDLTTNYTTCERRPCKESAKALSGAAEAPGLQPCPKCGFALEEHDDSCPPRQPVSKDSNRWVKKRIPITAVQQTEPFEVKTLEGSMFGAAGDWLVTGVEGEQYIIKDSIFRKTYEPANDLYPSPNVESAGNSSPVRGVPPPVESGAPGVERPSVELGPAVIDGNRTLQLLHNAGWITGKIAWSDGDQTRFIALGPDPEADPAWTPHGRCSHQGIGLPGCKTCDPLWEKHRRMK